MINILKIKSTKTKIIRTHLSFYQIVDKSVRIRKRNFSHNMKVAGAGGKL